MKTVILFGAGASIHAIPTVDEMYRHIPNLSERLKDPQVMKNCGKKHELSYLIRMLDELSHSLKTTQTPDRSLRKFYQNDKNSFEKWLKVFWVYLNILQTGKRNDIGLATSHNFRDYKFTDNRYSSLISDYLYDNEDNYTFLTWNYDVQFELAYKDMHSLRSMDSLYSRLSTFPSLSNSNNIPSKLIHLNGSSMFYNKALHGDSKLELSIPDYQTDLSINECLNKYLWMLSADTNMMVKLSGTLKFGFTYKKHELDKLKQNIQMSLKGCRKIIAIGYSFPKPNQEIDQYIFDSISPDAKIIIQNPVSQLDKLVTNFGIRPGQIKEVKDISRLNEFVAE